MKETLAQHWRVIALTLIALAVALISGIFSGILTGSSSTSASTSAILLTPPIYPTSSAVSQNPSHLIKVYVTGAVRVPGVYSMKETDRIADVIHVAGGAAINAAGVELADFSNVNLAEQLQDGERVNVPFKALPTATLVPTATPANGGCPNAAPTAAPAASIKVYVTGAVCKPGLYTLSATARVSDAIAAAGGPSLDADLASINLAAFVSDGQQVVVPSKSTPASSQSAPATEVAARDSSSGSATPPITSGGPSSTASGSGAAKSGSTSSTSKGKAVPSGKVNINTASAAEMAQYLSGVGPSIAQRIVDYRKQHGAFKRIEDLQNVKGIGPKIFEKLKPLITV